MAIYLSSMIADYIVDEVKKNAELSDGLNRIVSFKDIDNHFTITISRNSILAALKAHPEVADVKIDQNGFDVVIYGGEE